MAETGESTKIPSKDSENLVTALHIGAGSVSMIIAEKDNTGGLRLIDFLEQSAPLAQDVFGKSYVSSSTTERIVSIIQSYQEVLMELRLEPHHFTRAAATNVLHEAPNHEAVVNRIRIACGIPVSMIDDGEMTRLIYLKTQRRIENLPAVQEGSVLVVHVGPGNTRALLFEEGSISRYTSYRMGTHRTNEAIEGSLAEGSSLLRVIREQAAGNIAQLRHDYADVNLDSAVLIGYEIQSISSFLARANKACSVKRFRKFTEETAEFSELEAVKKFQLDYQTAEALIPALEINLAIVERLGLEHVHIPISEYEQGLLHDMLASSQHSNSFAREVLRSAKILAERYQTHPEHGEHVGKICEKLTNELQDLHQLTEHDALLLQVSAILHEVGNFISPRAHHKHSEYLILNSEIFGLDRLDVTIVALVSRYHRHSGPRMDHPIYASLQVEDRIRVSKLAAILRVADALERTHAQRVSKIEFTRTHKKLHIKLSGLEDTAVERLAMEAKGALFEEVFGLSPVVEEDR